MKFVVWMAYHLESRDIVDDYISRASKYVVTDITLNSPPEGVGKHEFVVCEDLESIKREIVDADVMLGWRITPEVFACARRLKWIQFGSAGIDHTIFPELLESNVILTTLSGIHSTVVAEHVIGLMIALARRFDLAARLQLEHRYERGVIASTAEELAGKTVGIIGLGKIGLNIARLAKAFGMTVVGTKRILEGRLENLDKVYRASEYRKILPISDYVILVVPLTHETRSLIGREELAMMKDGACLVNVARGAMVDHEALSEALRSGKLKGAALDVFPEEPLPPESPIWDMPNTIITPHTACSFPRYGELAAQVFKRNLEAFLTGGEMINVYERARGY
ncbi:MAG: D-2-hydroxyacid dehydrogenase [Armatimonadetes bacterium]|nr:D-2-hydroxyacid dehydrogenase [Armatimonadota bacterium]